MPPFIANRNDLPEVRSKGVKRTEWVAVVSAPIGAQVILYWIEAANRIGRATEGLGPAGLGLSYPCRTQESYGA